MQLQRGTGKEKEGWEISSLTAGARYIDGGAVLNSLLIGLPSQAFPYFASKGYWRLRYNCWIQCNYRIFGILLMQLLRFSALFQGLRCNLRAGFERAVGIESDG